MRLDEGSVSRKTLVALVASAALLFSGCGSCAGGSTGIYILVRGANDLGLDQVEVAVARADGEELGAPHRRPEDRRALTSAETVAVLLPDSLAGETLSVRVTGLRGEGAVAFGEADVVVEAGRFREALVELLPLPECRSEAECRAGEACLPEEGVCRAGCVIDGVFVDPGATASGDPCLVCAPEHRTDGWSYAAAGESCGEEMVCDGVGDCVQVDPDRGPLNVALRGDGNGTVSSTPEGIECGPVCGAYFALGTVVTLEARASEGSEFVGFESGGVIESASRLNLVVDGAVDVEARFERERYALTVIKAGEGSGSVGWADGGFECGASESACRVEVGHGDTVTLTASPARSSRFSGWSGACEGADPTCDIVVTSSLEVGARFELREHELVVDVSGPGSGQVGSDDGRIACAAGGASCSAAYVHGRAVTLTAAEDEGSRFVAWKGACAGASHQCQLTMSIARSTTAVFERMPHEVEGVSGFEQRSMVNTDLAFFVVRVSNQLGQPVAGHQVEFEILAAPQNATGQKLSATLATTDEEGLAKTALTLGDMTGVYAVAANPGSIHGSPVVFQAHATSSDAREMRLLPGSPRRGEVAASVGPFVVQVLDEHGNGVEGHPVSFEVAAAPEGASGHEVSLPSAMTDEDGFAETTLTLGRRAGVYQVGAAAAGEIAGSPVTSSVTAEAGPAHTLENVSGSDQSAVVTRALGEPFTVRVTDRYGNPVAGHPAAFTISTAPEGANGHSLAVLSTMTGAGGLASTLLTLGQRSGGYEVRAVAHGSLEGSPLFFQASALPDEAKVLIEVSGSEQTAKVGKDLQAPLSVRVVDEHGNGVADHDVSFGIVQAPVGAEGQSLIAPDHATSQGGTASAALRLGTRPGVYEVRVTAAGDLEGSPLSFTSTGLTGDAHGLERLFGDGQEGTVATSGPALVARVRDEHGNPVVGHWVQFEIIESPDGATGQGLSAAWVSTEADGTAATTLTLGTRSGGYAVRATAAGDLEGSPAVFEVRGTSAEAHAIEKRSGDGQEAPVVESLEPLVVRVVDVFGNPVEGLEIAFSIDRAPEEATSHSLSVSSTTTNDEGLAETTLAVCTRAGVYEVRGRAPRAATLGQALFTARTVAAEPKGLEKVSGDDQEEQVARMLSSFVVRVVDEFGNGVVSHDVSFAIESAPGGATGQYLTFDSMRTGGDGAAWTKLMLGIRPGEYEVVATGAGGLESGPVSFVGTALVGDAHLLERLSGDEQEARVTETTAEPLVVRVVDEYGNPVDGQDVLFEVTRAPPGATGHYLGTSSKATDAEGLAGTRLTFCTRAGAYEVRASGPGVPHGSPLHFAATALAAQAHTLEIVSGDGQEQKVSETLEPFVTRVVDEHGNPVEGHEVTFAIDSAPHGAEGQLLSVTAISTDAEGLVASVLSPTKVGAYLVSATADGALAGSPAVYGVTALVGDAQGLEKLSGSGQEAEVSETLGEPLVARVVDEHGNPVAGHEVTFAIASAPGGAAGQSLTTTSALTGEDGSVETLLTLGSRSGTYEVSATSAGLIGSPALFTATARPAPAHALERVSGDAQGGLVGEPLDEPFIVRVVDEHGNGVAGHELTFAIVSAPSGASGQSLSVEVTSTNAAGLAETVLTLGDEAGAYEVSATADGGLVGSPAVFVSGALEQAGCSVLQANILINESNALYDVVGEGPEMSLVDVDLLVDVNDPLFDKTLCMNTSTCPNTGTSYAYSIQRGRTAYGWALYIGGCASSRPYIDLGVQFEGDIEGCGLGFSFMEAAYRWWDWDEATATASYRAETRPEISCAFCDCTGLESWVFIHPEGVVSTWAGHQLLGHEGDAELSASIDDTVDEIFVMYTQIRYSGSSGASVGSIVVRYADGDSTTIALTTGDGVHCPGDPGACYDQTDEYQGDEVWNSATSRYWYGGLFVIQVSNHIELLDKEVESVTISHVQESGDSHVAVRGIAHSRVGAP